MTVLLVIHTIIVVLLIGIILIQRSSNDGFTGGGGVDSMMSGRAQANFLTKATSYLAAAFLISSLVLAYLSSHADRGKGLLDTLQNTKPLNQQEQPVSPAAPAAEPKAPEVPKAE